MDIPKLETTLGVEEMTSFELDAIAVELSGIVGEVDLSIYKPIQPEDNKGYKFHWVATNSKRFMKMVMTSPVPRNRYNLAEGKANLILKHNPMMARETAMMIGKCAPRVRYGLEERLLLFVASNFHNKEAWDAFPEKEDDIKIWLQEYRLKSPIQPMRAYFANKLVTSIHNSMKHKKK